MILHPSSFQILPFHYLQTCSWSISFPMDLRTTSASKKIRRERSPGRYKGVRMRAWGKWVSEIRLPRSGDRIWLGSYDSQENAARAYDAAVYCIHGESANFNFPANRRPELPRGSTVSLSKKDIQAIAADFSSADVSESSLMSSTMRSQAPSDKPASPKLLVSSRDMESACKVDSALFAPSSTTGTAVTALGNLELDDFLMLDTDWIADFY